MEITVKLSEQEIAEAVDRAVEVNQSVKRDLSVTRSRVESFSYDGKRTYVLTWVDGSPVACTCPAYHFTARECKHMRRYR